MASQNKDWGFYGTIKSIFDLSGRDTDKVFDFAENLISKIYDIKDEKSSEFLDSKWGRHLADEITFHVKKYDLELEEIKEAVKKTIEGAKWISKPVKQIALASPSPTPPKFVDKLKQLEKYLFLIEEMADTAKYHAKDVTEEDKDKIKELAEKAAELSSFFKSMSH